MSDASVSSQGVPNTTQVGVLGVIADATILPGEALTPLTGANAGLVGLANAGAAQTAVCIGLATIGATTGLALGCRYSGTLALSIAQWIAALADSSTTGLTPGKYYFVSATTNGKLTATAPATAVPVGIALTANTMLCLPQVPVTVA